MTQSKEDVLKRREEELETTDDLEVKDVCRNLTLDEIKENLKQGKPFALRLYSTGDFNKTHLVEDKIKGKKEVRENSKDDVLIKSNGIPVYAFAHIVDDTLMGTTTVVRGQEWYQSLPVHLELSEAFGFKPFNYAHTPNICVVDASTGGKRKISKRKDEFADVRYFLKTGYPTEAVIEYLLNLLNSDFEIWRKNNPTLPYTQFPFELKKIGVTNPMFDFLKLNDISKTIISKMSAEEVFDRATAWAEEWDAGSLKILQNNKNNLLKVLAIDRGGERPRKDITYFSEIINLYNYILPEFNPNLNFNFEIKNKNNLIEFLNYYANNYKNEENNQIWFENLKNISEKFNFVDNKTYKLNPENYSGSVSDTSKFVRIAITGRENSPELYSIMKVLGEDECKNRIFNLINYLKEI